MDEVSIDLRPGEIHALLGENGAGKTTLMRILAGILRADEGTIEIAGEPARLRGRRDATRLGVGMVQQHFGLVEELTGAENLLLGHASGHLLVHPGAADRRLREIAAELGLEVDPRRRVGDLTVGERQRLEILIALSADPRILIMDEPTASLATAEITVLAGVLRRLAEEGTAIVYITHKLREVVEIADRVTVMRRGRVVETLPTRVSGVDELARAMIGAVPPTMREARPHAEGALVCGLRGVSVADSRDVAGIVDLDLDLHAGRIVGVAGVVGNGQQALAEVLTGLASAAAGEIAPAPETIAFIPEDRAREGLANSLSILDNAIVHKHRESSLGRGLQLRRSAIRRFTQELVERSGVHVERIDAKASSLSGGNQQKLVLGRELETDPDLIVADNPYRGLDIGAIAAVREQLLEASETGRAAVLLISPDLDDLFDIADEIIVLFQGRIVGRLRPDETDAGAVGKMLSGIGEEP